jgi:hypothetical protein
MKKDTVRTVVIVVGVLVLVAIVALGSAAWLFMRSFSLGQVDERTASQQFDEIRGRFAGITPVLTIEDERPTVTRRPPNEPTSARLTTLHVLAWDSDDHGLARIDLPFWLLRLKSGPIEIASRHGRRRDAELNLTVEELERYGPTLILDHEGEDGERVLVWTE